jgi:hypothetical protein
VTHEAKIRLKGTEDTLVLSRPVKVIERQKGIVMSYKRSEGISKDRSLIVVSIPELKLGSTVRESAWIQRYG